MRAPRYEVFYTVVLLYPASGVYLTQASPMQPIPSFDPSRWLSCCVVFVTTLPPLIVAALAFPISFSCIHACEANLFQGLITH